MAGGENNDDNENGRIVLLARAAALVIATLVAGIGTLWLIFLPFLSKMFKLDDVDPGLGILGALIPILGFIVHAILKTEGDTDDKS